MKRRQLLRLAAAAAGLPLLHRPALALDYPTRSVHILRKINAGLTDAKLKKQLVGLGGAPMPMSPGEFATFIAAETDKWAKVIKFAGITVE